MGCWTPAREKHGVHQIEQSNFTWGRAGREREERNRKEKETKDEDRRQTTMDRRQKEESRRHKTEGRCKDRRRKTEEDGRQKTEEGSRHTRKGLKPKKGGKHATLAHLGQVPEDGTGGRLLAANEDATHSDQQVQAGDDVARALRFLVQLFRVGAPRRVLVPQVVFQDAQLVQDRVVLGGGKGNEGAERAGGRQ